jgi:hypothetical protein
MPVKLNHYYTIIPSRKKEYNNFIIRKFIPKINKLGMHAVAGWSSLVGSYSEIFFESISNDLDQLEQALRNPKYEEIKHGLLNYVKFYKTKVLVKTGKIDTYSTDIHEETIKFNQNWNVVPDYKEDYDRYTSEEFYPACESLGISIACEWEVLIGDGPGIIAEGRVNDVGNFIRNLQSKQFGQAKQKLKGYVENYGSRIYTFHIHKKKGYKSASYNVISD